jgi:hypothetical protein
MANVFKVQLANNITTTLTSVNSYSVAAATTTTVIGLSFCNTSNNSININATVANSTASAYIAANVPLPVGSSIAIVGGDQKVVLATGMSIKVSASANNSCDVVMSLLEIS